jgi:hypothetical protein
VVLLKTWKINKAQDLPVLMDWYRAHGWGPEADPSIFPETGFIVKDHAATWLYQDKEGKMGWVAYQVINPRKNMVMAFKALHALYERVDQEASRMGLIILKQTVMHSSLKKLAIQHNYVVTEENLTSLVKRVP